MDLPIVQGILSGDSERVNAQSLPNAIKETKTAFYKEKNKSQKIASILKENSLEIEY